MNDPKHVVDAHQRLLDSIERCTDEVNSEANQRSAEQVDDSKFMYSVIQNEDGSRILILLGGRRQLDLSPSMAAGLAELLVGATHQ